MGHQWLDLISGALRRAGSVASRALRGLKLLPKAGIKRSAKLRPSIPNGHLRDEQRLWRESGHASHTLHADPDLDCCVVATPDVWTQPKLPEATLDSCRSQTAYERSNNLNGASTSEMPAEVARQEAQTGPPAESGACSRPEKVQAVIDVDSGILSGQEAGPPAEDVQSLDDGTTDIAAGALASENRIADGRQTGCDSEQANAGLHTEVVAEETPSREGMRAPGKRQAIYKDRRGARRAPVKPPVSNRERIVREVRQAELRLRLVIDPIPRAISLSAVLVRGEGFPETLRAGFDTVEELCALDDRYGDLTLRWTPELLQEELRLRDSKRSFEWVRSRRDVHIFAEQSGESDLVSVQAATSGERHAIICGTADKEQILSIARSTQSPPLRDLSHWQGVPQGWAIFDGYNPHGAADVSPEERLRTLDPGLRGEIAFEGGLQIRSRVWAAGSPPTIRVSSLPPNSAVLIDGRSASVSSDGVCTAEGWDQPGAHLVNVVPGRSSTYQITPDPAVEMDWQDTVGMTVGRGVICGPRIISAGGKWVVARHGPGSVIALGQLRHAKFLETRQELCTAIGAIPFKPEFLIVSWGLRRSQGEIIWLDSGPHPAQRSRSDTAWNSAIRNAAARQLRIRPNSEEARLAWTRAVAAARGHRKGRV